jgi:hypothetical protein
MFEKDDLTECAEEGDTTSSDLHAAALRVQGCFKMGAA